VKIDFDADKSFAADGLWAQELRGHSNCRLLLIGRVSDEPEASALNGQG
jgi:hypothetical protein